MSKTKKNLAKIILQVMHQLSHLPNGEEKKWKKRINQLARQNYKSLTRKFNRAIEIMESKPGR